MSLDFANELFFTKVCSNSISSDNHNITNIISKEQREWSMGFQSERFVRAPIAIQFQFYVPVEISRIEFLPFIGRQCAKVIQLQVSKCYPLAKKGDLTGESFGETDDVRFRKAGSAMLSSPKRVSFINRAYKPHPQLRSQPPNPGSLEAFTHGDMGSLSALRIVIVNMLQGSVPSLAKLHIWGRPSRSCNRDLVKEIFDINDSFNPRIKDFTGDIVKAYGSSSCNYSMQTDVNTPEVPNKLADGSISLQGRECDTDCPTDFIDPLTFEMMRIPVLLPSGYTVDRLTLDKHIKSQSEMGNIPSDPFTGIPFTHSAKPEPNTRLKIRMDSYLYRLSRTSDGDKPTIASEVISDTSSRVSRKRQHQDGFVSEKVGYQDDAKRYSAYGLSIPSLSRNQEGHELESASCDSSSNRHSDELASSLNTALTSVNRHKGRLHVGQDEGSKLYCNSCKSYMQSSSPQYQLPCNHVFCRECIKIIRNDGMVSCPTCSTAFETSYVQRVYD